MLSCHFLDEAAHAPRQACAPASPCPQCDVQRSRQRAQPSGHTGEENGVRPSDFTRTSNLAAT